MALAIATFDNKSGGFSFFKAAGHPLAARGMSALLERLGAAGPVAVYDPLGFAGELSELYDLTGLEIAGYYVQDIEQIGRSWLGQQAQPVTDLKGSGARTVWIVTFDPARPLDQIRHLLPESAEFGVAEVESLASLRLPDEMLSDPRNYLSGLNFATNFAFFREGEGHHTRVVTADYWSGYGAREPWLWACLLDGEGHCLAEWKQTWETPGAAIAIDSAEVRKRFGLGPFTGQLFLHVCGVAGHEVVKYALDTYGDDETVLSCTHDANAWPADYYAGLPAPREGERVILWVQNSHPRPIPAGALGLNLMGEAEIAWLDREVPAYGTLALDSRELLPEAAWPRQIEVQAGRHMVRPRYEVLQANGRQRIAHVNVERTDLKPDPRIPEIANLMGKGYILPAPLLPPERYRNYVLPTPMARGQETLPTAALVYDSEGREVASRSLGRLPRNHATALDLEELVGEGAALNGGRSNGSGGGWGHVELVYDFAEGGEADGWLHAIFRYEDRKSGHAAETSFGAHMFNSVLTYRNEPQSYAGRAPGLSTRLFLRLGEAPHTAYCHLIYAASTAWHETSQTVLELHDRAGRSVAEAQVAIACGGSLLWTPADYFSEADLAAAAGGFVLIRDRTCRLFGYHGLRHGEGAFSLDHMFGF